MNEQYKTPETPNTNDESDEEILRRIHDRAKAMQDMTGRALEVTVDQHGTVLLPEDVEEQTAPHRERAGHR